MGSVGIRLAPWLEAGNLRVLPSRPTAYGLEMHLVSMYRAISEFEPDVVVVDPITNLITVGTAPEVRATMTRLIDFLKLRGTTTLFTSLTEDSGALEQSEVGISSLIDTWLMLQVVRNGGERNRCLTIIKSRGMAHSNQTSEYRLGDSGLELMDTYLGATGVLTGSARLAREAEDAAVLLDGAEEVVLKEQERTRRRKAMERESSRLREQFEAQDAALLREIQQAERQRGRLLSERAMMAQSRQAFSPRAGAARRERRP
jgi:circadian clock protein KaiC